MGVTHTRLLEFLFFFFQNDSQFVAFAATLHATKACAYAIYPSLPKRTGLAKKKKGNTTRFLAFTTMQNLLITLKKKKKKRKERQNTFRENYVSNVGCRFFFSSLLSTVA